MKIYHQLANAPWVISEPALNTLLSLANLEALTTQIQLPAPVLELNALTRIHNDIAIISIVGPLFRRMNLVSLLCGSNSYEAIAQAFTIALADPNIKGIVLDIDSPGGEVNGCAELANLIFESRSIKPIKAYASGACASGAYWIGSACEELCISETSCVGAIGVIAIYRADKSPSDIVEIVSSQSPFKCLDPKSDEGRLRLQKRIDVMADVFVQAVARHRGVDPPMVIEHFGSGDVFVGADAVAQGLADKVSTSKKTITSMITNNPSTVIPGASLMKLENKQTDIQLGNKQTEHKKLDLDTLQSEYPQLVQTLVNQGVAQGIQQERQRIGEIIAGEAVAGRERLAHHLAFNTELPAEIALTTLKAALSQQDMTPPAKLLTHGFEQVMASIENPSIEPAHEIDPDDPNILAKRIASFSQGAKR